MPYISISVLAKSIGVNGVHFDSLETVEVKQHRNGEVFTQSQIIAHVRPYKRLQMRCPCCQNVCPGYDTKRQEPSFWRGLCIGALPVFLAYTPRRIECPEHGVKTEYIPWSDGNSRFLPSFNNEVTVLAHWLCTVGEIVYTNLKSGAQFSHMQCPHLYCRGEKYLLLADAFIVSVDKVFGHV